MNLTQKIFIIRLRRNRMPDWTRLLGQMMKSGMDKDRALSKLSEAVSDVFGKDFNDEILKRLKNREFPE